MRNFIDCKYPVAANRGVPPDSFLNELVDWARSAPEEIFSRNENRDIYSLIAPVLGPFMSFRRRKAGMLEAMRVHAGFESSWNWNEGVDVTNRTSLAHITGQETGIFQVSFDSTYLGGPDHPMKTFATSQGVGTNIPGFIAKMKEDHSFALEYYGRLVRVNIKWAGPLVRREILPWLRRDSVAEFESFLL